MRPHAVALGPAAATRRANRALPCVSGVGASALGRAAAGRRAVRPATLRSFGCGRDRRQDDGEGYHGPSADGEAELGWGTGSPRVSGDGIMVFVWPEG